MKMRTTEREQLNLVLADSPQGAQAAEVPDLLGTAKARLYKAKGKGQLKEADLCETFSTNDPAGDTPPGRRGDQDTPAWRFRGLR
jgi:hypothetical protein